MRFGSPNDDGCFNAPRGRYIGSELDIFCQATNWKRYYKQIIAPYFGKAVLEVGAGIGATTLTLAGPLQKRWVCLEPDAEMAGRISSRISSGELPAICEVSVGTLAELPVWDRFDSILYIDVLEHIEDDRRQVELALERLRPGGHLIIVAPAHMALFTPFDAAIGHFRRYDRGTLAGIMPRGVTQCDLRYVDCAGALLSLGNRFLLGQSVPTKEQILFWDRVVIPISRVVDPLFAGRLGKSIIGIWRRDADSSY